MKAHDKKRRVYVSYMNPEVLELYDVGSKVLNGIKSIYVNILAMRASISELKVV